MLRSWREGLEREALSHCVMIGSLSYWFIECIFNGSMTPSHNRSITQ